MTQIFLLRDIEQLMKLICEADIILFQRIMHMARMHEKKLCFKIKSVKSFFRYKFVFIAILY